jgi:hypothetical protein
MSQKNIPCDFVFDYLMPLEVTVKPMFGVRAIYVDKKIMLVLKQRKDSPETNGVWIAHPGASQSLRKELPSLC